MNKDRQNFVIILSPELLGLHKYQCRCFVTRAIIVLSFFFFPRAVLMILKKHATYWFYVQLNPLYDV